MKIRIAALGALLALALSGCSGTPGESEESHQTVAPLTAEMPEETAAPETPDEEFLTRIRAELPEDTVIPGATDEQLLSAADAACEQMNSGTDVAAVNVIEGEEPNDLDIYESSAAIAGVAKDIYCPQGY